MVGRTSSLPSSCSSVWLQRGCATAGFTLAQNPYSDGCTVCQNPLGRSSTKLNRTGQRLRVGPRVPGLALARRHRTVEKALHPDVLGRPELDSLTRRAREPSPDRDLGGTMRRREFLILLGSATVASP